MTRRPSAPMYPRYYGPAPERTLAFYDSDLKKIVDEHENLYTVGDNLSTFRSTMFDNNLLLFVDNVASFPHMAEMIHDYPRCLVLCDSAGNIIGGKLFGSHNSTRWVVSASRWGAACSADFLNDLHTTYCHCDVGTPATPGGLGQALMRRVWAEHDLSRHTRPHSGAIQMLHAHSFGGRVDTPDLGQTYEKVLELDRKNAYASEFGRHPTGTAHRIAANYNGGDEELYFLDRHIVTWFGACDISLPHTLRYGPFPIRMAKGTIEYPVRAGKYTSYLWREQADDVRLAGGTVRFLDGWGWTEWTDDNQHWVAIAEHLRRTAPTPTTEQHIKKAIVSGIGRHAMGNTSYCLVPEEAAGPEDESVSEHGYFYNFYVHPFADPFHANMTHWNSYTVMQMSRALYHKALPYANLGWLVATNYDAIYLKLWGYDEIALPEKGSEQDRNSASGIWRQRLIVRNKDNNEPMFPAPRALNAQLEDGTPYIRRPGVKQ